MKKELTDNILELEDWKWGFWFVTICFFCASMWIVELKLDIEELKYKYPKKVICMENYCIVNKTKYLKEIRNEEY